MKFMLKRKDWRPLPHGATAMHHWDILTVNRLVDFLTTTGLEVPRILRLRQSTGGIDEQPDRNKNESVGAYRRRMRRWRKEKHGSIRKMRLAKKAQQVKEQRWALLREQGFPLKDPEALIWFIKKNMWDPKTKLAQYGYLHHTPLIEVAGGVLPTGIDFDDVFYKLSRRGKAARAQRQGPARAQLDPPPSAEERFRSCAETGLRAAYKKAKFRLKNRRDSINLTVNNAIKGETGVCMSITDTARPRRGGRNRHETEVEVRVNLDWYRKVYLAGLANAAGERSLVLDVKIDPRDGGEIALVARQSASRYALKVDWLPFGKNADGTYWFAEEK